MDDIGAIDDFQRRAHVMIGDQHADAAVAQMHDQIADIAERNRIDARERLVEQNEMRLRASARAISRRRRSPPDNAIDGARRNA